MQDISFIAVRFPIFILVMFRIAGIMMLAPLFGSRNIPMRVRALLAIMMAIVVLPVVPVNQTVLPGTVAGFVVAVASETAIGLILGFASSLVFVGVQLGGHLIGQQMGLTVANVIDPISNEEVSVTETVLLLFAVTLFILMKGHHLLIAAIVGTFRLIPLMGLTYRPEMLLTLSDSMFGEIFVIAAKVAAPAIAALMLTSVALAFIARTVPEMNIFNVGFTVQLALGLVVVALAVPGLAHLLGILFGKVAGNLETIRQLMAI